MEKGVLNRLDLEEAEEDRFDEEIGFLPETTLAGWLGSIRKVVGTSFAMLETRIELFTIELKEAKTRIFALVAVGIALVFLVFLTLVAIMATVVFLLWSHALVVLIGFSVFFLVLATVSFLMARGQLQKLPFEETVGQLKKDRILISGERNRSQENEEG
ncbi:MAG: phage holin family protein [Verrucomicrobiota bacterium]